MRYYKRFVDETFDENGNLSSYSIKDNIDFNFGYDHVDYVAEREPDRLAIMYVNDKGFEKRITYKEWSDKSNALASFFMSIGVKKGDRVMLVMKRNYEFWYTYVALHKIGAIAIPATYQLQDKDYIYRFNAAGVSAIVATGDPQVLDHIDNACTATDTVKNKIICRGEREGWLSFDKGIENAPPFVKPTGDDLPKARTGCLYSSPPVQTACPKWRRITSYIRYLTFLPAFTGTEL